MSLHLLELAEWAPLTEFIAQERIEIALRAMEQAFGIGLISVSFCDLLFAVQCRKRFGMYTRQGDLDNDRRLANSNQLNLGTITRIQGRGW
jgi:hypothetical protein